MSKEKEILEGIQKNSDIALVEDLLADNQNEFEVEGVKYRVVKPTYKQKQEIYAKQAKKFQELLRAEEYLLEEDLKAQLRKKGVDIDVIIKRINAYEIQKNNLLLKLGEIVKNGGSQQDKDKLVKEISAILEEQQILTIKKSKHLEYSIENQVLIYSYSYLTYLISEKLEGDKWVRVFSSYEEMENFPDEKVVNNLSIRAVVLSQNEIENI